MSLLNEKETIDNDNDARDDIRSQVSRLLSKFFDEDNDNRSTTNTFVGCDNKQKLNVDDHHHNNGQQHQYSIGEVKNFNEQLRNQLERIFDRNEELQEELQLHLQYNRQLLLEVEKFEQFKNEIDQLTGDVHSDEESQSEKQIENNKEND